MSQTPLFVSGSAGETFGRVLHTRAAGRFLFRESRYRPALRMPAVYHPRPYFSYIVEGAVRERGADAEHVYAAGSLHFHPAGDPHQTRLGDDGATCMSIVVVEPLPSRFAPPGGAVPAPVARLAHRCHRELRAGDSAAELALEAAALELIAALLRRTGTRERRTAPWLLEVRDYLHAHYLERIRLAELSAVAGIHEVHLVRAFRGAFGQTPGHYVRGLRVEHARRALAGSDMPLAELALEAGFSSQAHFTRVFHRLAGNTPAAFRRERRRR